MSTKPSVTMTLAGDEKKLTEAFDRVGASSTAMADKVSSAGKEMDRAGTRFDDMAEKSDTAETRATGFADVLTGATEGLAAWNDESLSGTEKMIALGQAGADLAGGLTGFLIPAIGSLATMMKVQLGSAFTFIAAHPLLIVIGLIIAAIVLLITQTDWFQAVAVRVFNWVGNLVKNVFGASVDWVVARWNGLMDWFEALPRRIGAALGAVGGFIADAFKGGVNMAIGMLNWGIDRINNLIYGVNLISPFNDVPYIPHIPRLHTGGMVPGMPGTETLIMAKAGEHVSAPGQGGASGTLVVRGTGALAELLQAMIYNGDLQLEGR